MNKPKMRNSYIALLAIVLSACATKHGKDLTSIRISTVGTIIDGDSFKANINQWPDIIGKSITIRVANIDTPELRGQCQKEKNLARKAKQFTAKKLRHGKNIELKNIKRGKYFRIIADVYIDGNLLAKELLDEGLAVIYSKKSKINWCRDKSKLDSGQKHRIPF